MLSIDSKVDQDILSVFSRLVEYVLECTAEAFHVWVRITREISTQEDMRVGVMAVYEAADHLQSRVLMDNPWTTARLML